MNILITAGSPRSPIDRVRGMGTVFTGRTGAGIATAAWARGHTVTLLTANPRELPDVPPESGNSERRMTTVVFHRPDDLGSLLQKEIKSEQHAVLIHTASTGDYQVAGTFAPELGTYFNGRTREWESRGRSAMIEQSPDRVDSTEPELWVRLVRSPRLIDRVRSPWGFRGLLVRFTLEIGLSDGELRGAAEFVRKQSHASLMVAGTADAYQHWVILGPVDGKYERVSRRELPERLVLQIEHLRQTNQGSWHDTGT